LHSEGRAVEQVGPEVEGRREVNERWRGEGRWMRGGGEKGGK